ncbi:hypothetical protein [Burkholderia sp. 22PA0106]|uniref:hypothetical protein n=1 Tax=Burkholderia sp. 22PA0106 TaxID=3237371 RepID=UPI0039C42590
MNDRRRRASGGVRIARACLGAALVLSALARPAVAADVATAEPLDAHRVPASAVVATTTTTEPIDAHRAPAGAVVAVPAPGFGDERRFMHGIATASAGHGNHWVFFSSSGLPPRGANADGSWPHDVYVGRWAPGQAALAGVHRFIGRPEAQEPVSVAQNTDGRLFVTFEDGWNAPRNVSQRFGVYRDDLTPIVPYPSEVESGGHSGHVAAVGRRFVVFYSEGWVQGGGIDNLGSGDGVAAKVYDGAGTLQRRVEVMPHGREWWPMIAGSPSRALLVWQKFIPGDTIARLRYALLDPATGQFVRMPGSLDDLRVQYYTYAAEWVPAVGRFVLEATLADGRTTVMLIDEAGQVTARLACLPASVREAGVVVDGANAYVPTRDGRLMALALTGDSITLHGLMPAPFAWGNTGVTGIANGPASLHMVSLSPSGLREADFDTRQAVPPAESDRCGP